ncbi:MAG: hypothetical protein KBT03_11125 [Bacteroidales bacterium]|nr:hypothetical protein [Candidatus Scybalousia scybalohippi]
MASTTDIFKPTNKLTSIKSVTSDFTHVYFKSESGDNVDYSAPDIEFPVVEGSINYSLGEVDYEYVKLVTGATWATKRTKGDPDISFQIAANDQIISELFGEVSKYGNTGKLGGQDAMVVDVSSVHVLTGAVIFADDTGHFEILPKCELTASRGKDSVAYWNVKVVPGNTVILPSVYTNPTQVTPAQT